MQSQIRKVIVNDSEITDPKIIPNEIRNFHESHFKKGDSKRPSHINDFLDKVQLPKLNITEINECEDELSEKELHTSLMSKQNDKLPNKRAKWTNKKVFCKCLGGYKRCFFKFMSYSKT